MVLKAGIFIVLSSLDLLFNTSTLDSTWSWVCDQNFDQSKEVSKPQLVCISDATHDIVSL